MSEDGRQIEDSPLEQVARAWAAAGFDETPPEHVDRAVLSHAARGAVSRRWKPRPRHLAWAAVLALSFTLVLDVTMGPDRTTMQRSSERAASDADLPTDQSAESVAPASAPAGDAALRSLNREARRSATPGNAGSTAAPRDAQAFAIQPDAAAAACSDSDRSTPEAWLDCIARLAPSARTAELAQFRARHPDLPIPAELSTDRR